MITKVFAVYDTKAVCYMNPFFMSTNGMAVRGFMSLVNDKNSTVSQYPTDYMLFEIGSFDDVKGVLEPLIPPVNLGLGSDFVKQEGVKHVFPS